MSSVKHSYHVPNLIPTALLRLNSIHYDIIIT